MINRILHSCSCIIEFIKLVGENRHTYAHTIFLVFCNFICLYWISIAKIAIVCCTDIAYCCLFYLIFKMYLIALPFNMRMSFNEQ